MPSLLNTDHVIMRLFEALRTSESVESLECKPVVRLLSYLRNAPLFIAAAAKLTLSSKPINDIMDSMDDDTVRMWIKELVKRGHGTPLEHGIYSFEITCSRVASHQIIRHRIASYTQVSQRRGDKIMRSLVREASKYIGLELPKKPRNRDGYVLYSKIINEVIESAREWDKVLNIVCKAFIIPPRIYREKDLEYIKRLLRGLRDYYKALANGYHPEDARFLLPQAVKTRLYVTMNARELIENFLPLRMCNHAQWEIRYIAWSLWSQLRQVHPILFDYAGPRCILYENRVRREPCTLKDFLEGKCEFVIERCPELVSSKNIPGCIKAASIDLWDNRSFLANLIQEKCRC